MFGSIRAWKKGSVVKTEGQLGWKLFYISLLVLQVTSWQSLVSIQHCKGCFTCDHCSEVIQDSGEQCCRILDNREQICDDEIMCLKGGFTSRHWNSRLAIVKRLWKRRGVVVLQRSCQAAITLNGIQPLSCERPAGKVEQGTTPLGHGCVGF